MLYTDKLFFAVMWRYS